MVPNNIKNFLAQHDGKWDMPLVRKFGHMYLERTSRGMIFTKNELIKLHRHFRHPSYGKVWELIKRARPHQADENTKKMWTEITKSCETCQTFSAPPQRFTVSLPPSDIVFNQSVAMDLTWIEGNAVLHIVDKESHFNAACFLKSQTIEGVLESFVTCWASLYIGYPEKFEWTRAAYLHPSDGLDYVTW